MSDPIFRGSVALGEADQQGLKGIALFGSHAFVNNKKNATFYVVDIGDPTTPTQVAALSDAVFGSAQYPITDGDYVYLCSDDGYLAVVNVKDTQNPYLVSSQNVGAMRNITLWGKYVVGPYDKYLRVIDISNPASPVKVGEYIAPGSELFWSDAVEIWNNHAYCVANYRLTVIDLTDPTKPTLISCFDDYTKIGDQGHDIKITNGYAFIADQWRDRLSVFNISQPMPEHITHVDDGVKLNGNVALELSGQYAYCCADYGNYLTVVDISNIVAPSIIGSLHDDIYLDGVWGIQLAGKYAYISACDVARVTVLEVIAPTVKTVTFNSVPVDATVSVD